jgi:hypothetical protein
MKYTLVVIDSLDTVIDRCLDAEDGLLGLDTEQPDLDICPAQDRTISVQLAPNNYEGYLFPLRFADASKNLPIARVQAAFRRIWSAVLGRRLRLVIANATYDLDALHTWHKRYWPKTCLEDPIARAWIADPVGAQYGIQYGLKQQVKRRLETDMLVFTELAPLETIEVQHPRIPGLTGELYQYHFEQLDPRDERTLRYGCEDAMLARRLLQAIKLTPQQEHMYRAEIATGENVRRMRAAMHFIDIDAALELHARLHRRRERIESLLQRILPAVEPGTCERERRLTEVWRSALERVRAGNPATWTRRYRGPSPRTGREINLTEARTWARWSLSGKTRDLILRDPLATARQRRLALLINGLAPLNKDLTTYLPAILACRDDGSLRFDMRTTGLDTARFNGARETANKNGRVCWQLNVVTLPRRPTLRQCFASPAPLLYCQLDVASEEPVIAANLSEDPSLQYAFQNGLDFHATTATHVFNKPIRDVTPAERSMAKAIGLALLYTKSPVTLAAEFAHMGRNLDWAIQIRDRIANGYEGLATWARAAVLKMAVAGQATSAWGRIVPNVRPCEDMPSINTSYHKDGANSHIQSSGSDIMRILVDATLAWLDENAPGSRLVVCVHDSLDLHVMPEHVRLMPQLCRVLQERCTPPDWVGKAPLRLDCKIGFSMGQLYDYGSPSRKTFVGDRLRRCERLDGERVVCDWLSELF